MNVQCSGSRGILSLPAASENNALTFCGQHLPLLRVLSLEAPCPGCLERSSENQTRGVLPMVLQNGDCRSQMFCLSCPS